MPHPKSVFAFSRNIKLAPAIGDWTTIQYHEPELEEVNISSVRNINFDSLPREQMKYVHYLHYRVSEKIATKLSQDLDIKVELHSVVATQMVYEDFLNAQQEKIVQTDLSMGENGRVNVLLEWSLAAYIINRLTGGKGENSINETFSAIEGEIIKTQMEELTPYFMEAWKSIIPKDQVQLHFYSGYYTPDRKLSPREAFVIFTCYLNIGNEEQKKITWAYPNHILRRLIQARQSMAGPIKKRIKLYPDTMEKVKMPVKAILGETTLRMEELKGLQIGDVITLNTRLDAPLEIQVGADHIKFEAQPGTINQKVCVQLLVMNGQTQINPQKIDPILASPPLIEEEPLHEEEIEEESVADLPLSPSIPDEIHSAFLHDEEEEEPFAEEPEEVLEEELEEDPEEITEEDDEWETEDDLEIPAIQPTMAEASPTTTNTTHTTQDAETNEEDWDDDFSWDDLEVE